MADEKKQVVFSRPVFAHDLLTDEIKKKFDDLPDWSRHLIKRLIDHGSLERAAQEAGVSTHVKKMVDVELAKEKSIKEALLEGGLTKNKMVAHLADCIQAETVRYDKHGNPQPGIDLNVKLKALELAFKLSGDLQPAKPPGRGDKGAETLFLDTPVE